MTFSELEISKKVHNFSRLFEKYNFVQSRKTEKYDFVHNGAFDKFVCKSGNTCPLGWIVDRTSTGMSF